MAAKKKNTAGMAFIVSALKRDRKAQYADIKARADRKGLTIYPIMYGRAQALLGIVKSAKRGTGRFARKNRGEPTRVLKPAGRRVGSRSVRPGEGLDALVEIVRTQGRERDQLRATLEKVRDLVASAI